MNSAPTQGLEPYKKEHLRFQRTNQMLHKSNARLYKLKNCGNQTLWVESALVAQCTTRAPVGANKDIKMIGKKTVGSGHIMLQQYCGFWLESSADAIHYSVQQWQRDPKFPSDKNFLPDGGKRKMKKSSATKSNDMLSLSSRVFFLAEKRHTHRQGICPKKKTLWMFFKLRYILPEVFGALLAPTSSWQLFRLASGLEWIFSLNEWTINCLEWMKKVGGNRAKCELY